MQTSQQIVSSLYLAYFGRPADPAGLAYWAAQLDGASITPTSLISFFSDSSEATSRFSKLSPADHIANVYQQLLGREPEPLGAAYWLGEVTAGRTSIGEMAVSIYNGALGRDALTVGARQSVADKMTSLLGINDTTYHGPIDADIARMIIQATSNTTNAADSAALSALGVKLVADANASMVTALIGTNGSMTDLLKTPAGKADPLALIKLVDSIVTAVADKEASLTTLLGSGTLTDLLTNLRPGVTLTEVETAITGGGLEGGAVVVNPPVAPPGNDGPGSPPAPTFVATLVNGVVTFSGTATGDITVTDSAGGSTFTRAGVTAEGSFALSGTATKITLVSGQTISATAQTLDKWAIDGAGTVVITALQAMPSADLSKITSTNVTATVTASANLSSVDLSKLTALTVGADGAGPVNLTVSPQQYAALKDKVTTVGDGSSFKSSDATAPATTIASVSYDQDSHTLTLTGTQFTDLLESSESAATDIKGRLDWSKLVWDINADGATTANVAFALADISSALVTHGTTLTIKLSDTKASALEGTTGYHTTGGSAADSINIAAGFIRDISDNASTTAGLNGPIAMGAV